MAPEADDLAVLISTRSLTSAAILETCSKCDDP
jgi:hypothetical protein